MTSVFRKLGKFARRPAVRLAAAYALILMLLSLCFSLVLYHFAVAQLAQGLGHQYLQFGGDNDTAPAHIFDPNHLPTVVQDDLDSGRHGLMISLAYYNLVVLLIGTALSYWLARRTLRPIEAALDAQSRFTADASHELRTPLAVMQTEIEIARTDPTLTKADALALIDSNLEEVKKLHRLSDGLLRLARSEVRPLELTALSLETVAHDVVDRVAASAKARQVSLLNDTSGLMVNGDHESIVELVAILLDNAIKYSPAGSSVTLTTERHGHANWLNVVDHGQGIEPADVPHIFDRFYRADKSRTGGDVSGHGLGLSLAKKIADLHRAEISAISKVGHGSTFTVKLRAV